MSREARRPAWLLARLGKDSRMAQWLKATSRAGLSPEPSGRERHLAYRTAKRRAAAR